MKLIGNVQLVAGNSNSIGDIFKLLEQAGIKTRGNPDVHVQEYRSFGADEARELAQRASSRAIASERRIFVIVTPSMTSEAQNALLKTLEEPSGDALFFVVVPSPEMLLATLRSRAQILSFGSHGSASLVDAAAFLKAVSAKRLDMLKPLLEKDEDDKRDLGAGIAFLASIEGALSDDIRKNREGLKAVYRARKYFGDKGSLVKALLEQVALLVD